MSRRRFYGFASMFLMGVCFGPAVGLAQVPKFTISTVAGNGVSGFAGDGGPATAANLAFPAALTFDSAGNMYIADASNSRVRKVDTNGTITTFAGTGDFGDFGDTNVATKAGMNRPYGVVMDKAGNLYIADAYNDAIRKVAASGGIMSTFAGTFQGFGGDGGGATGALMDTPTALVFDAAGNLYIADTNNHRIRKVGTDGNITTFAGNGNAADFGDGGPATSASLNSPEGLAIDNAGNIYVADTASHRVRKISPDGTITTVAGNGSGGFQGDGGPATKANLYYPKGLAVDASSGNLYIADWLNSRIRVVTPDGNIYTVAGNGSYDYYGDGGPATSAALRFPWGLAVDAAGNVYVADDENSTIRKLTPVAPLISALPTALPQIDASGVVSDSSFGGFSSVAPGTWIEIHGSNLATRRARLDLRGFPWRPGPHLARRNRGHHRRPRGVYFLHQPDSNRRAGPVGRGAGCAGRPRDHRRRNQRSPDDCRESSSTGIARSRFAERRRQTIHRSAFYGREHLRPPGRSDAQWDRSSCPSRGDDRSVRCRVWQCDPGPRRRPHRRRTTTA